MRALEREIAHGPQVHTVQVPEAEEDPGDVVAAIVTSNNQWATWLSHGMG